MHVMSLNGLAFQSIINIIIENKPFYKGSTTTTIIKASTKAGIKKILINLFYFFVQYL